MLVRARDKQRDLDPREHAALRHLAAAQRRRGDGIVPGEEDAERVRRRLQDMLVDVDLPPGFDGISPEHRLALSDGIDLRPVLFVVLQQPETPLGFLGAFHALVFSSCDGRHDVNALCGVAAQHGYQVSPTDIATVLSRLQTLHAIDVTSMMPVRKPDVMIQPDAYVARTRASDLGYLFGADEVDVIIRCRDHRMLGNLITECAATTDADRRWLEAVVARAAALGMIIVSPDPRRAALQPPTPPVLPQNAFAGEESTALHEMDDLGLDGETVLESGLAGAPASWSPAVEDITPSGAAEVVTSAQSYAQRPMPMPMPPMATPMPMAMPSRPSGSIAPPMRPTPLPIANDSSRDSKLASLAALSLDKGNVLAATPTAAPRAGSSRGRWLPWALLALALVGGTIYHLSTVRGLERKTAATPDKTPETPSTSSHALLATGYIAAKAPIVLSATTSGRVEAIKVKNGDPIKRGQLLAIINDGPVRAELGLANTRVRDARRALVRTKKLVQAEAATPADLERALGAVEIAAAEARVIGQKLEATRIRSPIDGTVLELLVQPGESITTGATSVGVLRIADLRALVAEVNVGESSLKEVSVAQVCEVTSDAQRDKPYTGIVREIAEQADRARGTVLVKIDIQATPDMGLKPGMAVQVRFQPPAPDAPKPDPDPGSGSDTGSATGSGSGSAAN